MTVNTGITSEKPNTGSPATTADLSQSYGTSASNSPLTTGTASTSTAAPGTSIDPNFTGSTTPKTTVDPNYTGSTTSTTVDPNLTGSTTPRTTVDPNFTGSTTSTTIDPNFTGPSTPEDYGRIRTSLTQRRQDRQRIPTTLDQRRARPSTRTSPVRLLTRTTVDPSFTGFNDAKHRRSDPNYTGLTTSTTVDPNFTGSTTRTTVDPSFSGSTTQRATVDPNFTGSTTSTTSIPTSLAQPRQDRQRIRISQVRQHRERFH